MPQAWWRGSHTGDGTWVCPSTTSLKKAGGPPPRAGEV
jgi:hypothetical protein